MGDCGITPCIYKQKWKIEQKFKVYPIIQVYPVKKGSQAILILPFLLHYKYL
jgi:hypothetical protein